MPIEYINKKNISDEIFEQIKGNIISGEWKPGDKIPSENELKLLLGVSRNSVRAALQRLTVLGLLRVKLGEGTYVSNLSPDMHMNSLIPMFMLNKDELIEMLEFRKVIEIESAKLAAQRAEPEDISKLERLIEDMFNEKYEHENFALTDFTFHEAVVKISKNSVMLKVYVILKEVLLYNQIEIQKLIGPQLAYKYHPLILKAIKDRDYNAAVEVMQEHINLTIEGIGKINNIL